MKSKTDSLFRPSPKETLLDRTTAEARAIVESEALERSERTASLKAARLERDALLGTKTGNSAKSINKTRK